VIPQALGADLQTEVGVLRIGKGPFAFLPTEVDPQIATGYRSQMTHGGHTFIVGLASDELGYQVPFAKWDNSCHACAPFVLAGVAALCPIQPIDCGTVFLNNVGRQVDPAVTSALGLSLDALDDERCARTQTEWWRRDGARRDH